jgi:hypothetical protein
MAQRKKDPSVRARRNTAASKATLSRVEHDTTHLEVFEAMTVVQLRAAIDVVNQSRPDDQKIPKRGTKAELVALLAAANNDIPTLPKHPPRMVGDIEVAVTWHAQTLAWWNDVWTSPMAKEWDVSDVHNVLVVALLFDDIWAADTPKARKEALSEFRLQRADLGLSPYSRRRLEWTIETASEAKERGEKRRTNGRKPVEKPASGAPKVDPRSHLAAVP